MHIIKKWLRVVKFDVMDVGGVDKKTARDKDCTQAKYRKNIFVNYKYIIYIEINNS